MTRAEDTSATIRSLKANASALGLTWNLRLATVTTGGLLAAVRLDGDDTANPSISAISLIGVVTKGSRVMTLWIPPNTLYVIGFPGGTVARVLTNRIYRPSTGDLTLTAVDQAVAGTLTSVNTTGAAEWEATAFFDFHQTVGVGPATGVGSLYVDGVAIPSTVALGTLQVVGDRVTVGQQWSGAFTTGGTHTFELRALKAGAGTTQARLNSTTMLVNTYE